MLPHDWTRSETELERDHFLHNNLSRHGCPDVAGAAIMLRPCIDHDQVSYVIVAAGQVSDAAAATFHRYHHIVAAATVSTHRPGVTV